MNKYGKNIKQNISTPKIKVIIKRTYCYTENKKIINYISDTHAFSREDTKWSIYMIIYYYIYDLLKYFLINVLATSCNSKHFLLLLKIVINSGHYVRPLFYGGNYWSPSPPPSGPLLWPFFNSNSLIIKILIDTYWSQL